MGSLIKEKGHELIAFDTSGVMSDIFGDVMLASKNRNPDPKFTITNPNGKMKYMKFGRAPNPDGWGVYVKGPSGADEFSEQNGYPLPMGDEPHYDLDHPLVKGAPLPEQKDYIDIAQPDAPRAVIFVTGDKAYPTGWYCAGYAWGMKHPRRITTPDPNTAGFIGSRSEPFQMSGSLGKAFYIPTPPTGAELIYFYLTNVFATSIAALSGGFFEQFVIKIDNNPSNIVEFRGPLKTGDRASASNKTKLEYWGGPGGFNVDKDRGMGNKAAYDVQFAYDLVDETGHSVGTTSPLHHMGADSGQHFRFHPTLSSLNDVVKESVKGWRPYVRYRKDNDWGKWQTIMKNGGNNTFQLDTWVKVFGPPWYPTSGTHLANGQPPTKDTSGIPNATEPMAAVDATLSLNSSGLQNGEHRIKAVLYDDGMPSEPSAATKVDISASNQVPRIYQPSFTNNLDNPDMIDTNATTNRPRDWTFNRDARTTYERGKLTVDETDGQAARGDLIITPYGYIPLGEVKFNGRIIIEHARHVTGKAVDVLMEYRVDSYSSTGVPSVTFLQQSTLGVHRRNGRYTLGFRTNNTRARDSIPLHAQTNLVVIKTIGDGSDGNLGVRNYTTIRKGHGIFRTMAPNKRKTQAFMDKIDWWEPDEESYPHGGYCRVVNSGDDPTIQGVTMNKADTGISITSGVVNNTSSNNKTFEVRFRTGEDITTQQVVYRMGTSTNGVAVYIEAGQLRTRIWQAGTVFSGTAYTLTKHGKYIVSVVRDGTNLLVYVDGVLVGSVAAATTAFAEAGTVSAGYNNGTFLTATATPVTAASNMLGRIYEVRAWNVARTATQISNRYATTIPDTDDIANLHLYLLMDEMEGTTTYDKSGNASNGTLVGNTRWIIGDYNAAWRDGSSQIDRVNFKDGTLPSPWAWTGTATSTIGDFSASRFSVYGARITGTGTNLRYASRTLTGIGSTFTAGIQQRYITLPTGGNPTLLQIRDATGAVAEAQLTTAGQLQVRGPGAGAWTTFLSGIEAGERRYFEVRCEGLGTANGIIRVLDGQYHDEELSQVAMLTGINFTSRGVTEVRAGNSAVTASITNTWDIHIGEIILSTNGKVFKEYIPGNYIEYYGPVGTPVNEQYGLYDMGFPVAPGEQITHSIYATCTGLVAGEDDLLGATIYNKDDEEVGQLPPLVQFDDVESEWKRYSYTFTVPADAAYVMYDRNNVGQGTYRIQGLQIEDGPVATQFTALYGGSGYTRVKFDSVLAGCETGTPTEALGKVVALMQMGFNGIAPANTTISLQIASASTENGTYTSYYSTVAGVPKNRWYEIKASLTTTDPDTTPVVKGIWLGVQRPLPMLLKPNGEEYVGGTLINNMAAPAGRRLVEPHQMDDGSGGFTTWGSGAPTKWISGFEVDVFRESVVDEITKNVGYGDSTFKVEYMGTIYTIRVVEPIEFEPFRAHKVTLNNGEDEPFYHFRATMPAAEVVGVEQV